MPSFRELVCPPPQNTRMSVEEGIQKPAHETSAYVKVESCILILIGDLIGNTKKTKE